MANIKSAKKRIKQSEKRRHHMRIAAIQPGRHCMLNFLRLVELRLLQGSTARLFLC